MFWDFDDTMYLVHKDISDRLWGDSGIRHFFSLYDIKLFQHSIDPTQRDNLAMELSYQDRILNL